MDLLATVRKEGARGGRGDFKWSDVQSSTHRENYLGHSLMAPVGRWQKGRDLNWYAKSDGGARDGEDPAAKAERERKDEIKRIKEAEQDVMARTLGYEVAPRNPNMEALGDRKEVDKILKEAADEEDDDEEGGKGVGFGVYGGIALTQRHLLDQRREGSETVAVTEVERAGAGARTEYEILIGGEEGMSTAGMMADATQDRERDSDDTIQDLDHTIVKGGEMNTVSLREETTRGNEVTPPTGVTSIDEAMTTTTDMTEDIKAWIDFSEFRKRTRTKRVHGQTDAAQLSFCSRNNHWLPA